MLIAGTGSRSFVPTPEIDAQMRKLITEQRKKNPDLMLMSGMAEGWDEYIARLAIRAGLGWIAAVPNRGYGDYYWRGHSLSGRDRGKEFAELLAQATEVAYVCRGIYGTLDGRRTHANFIRNQYMVDRADAFYVYNPTSRGTADCLRRIKKVQKPYKVIQ